MDAPVPAHALPIGTRVERYVIQAVLGAGGFGITYLAEHELLKKPFAVKEHFPTQFATRDSASGNLTPTDVPTYQWALDRFLQEARVLARCKHPNIVAVMDVLEANNTGYMVLEYEDGPSFDEWLNRLGRRPTQGELDTLLTPLLHALAYVHGQGLLHRDIAVDNVVVRNSDGSPCLIDFGAAREAVASQSRAMSAIIKAGYSPPEQYARLGKAQGPWSDIYALAATLYRAVSGKPPPEATERQLEDELTPLSEILDHAHDYRPGFLSAVESGLRLTPSERPQSIDEFSRKLMESEDKPSSLLKRFFLKEQRHPPPLPDNAHPFMRRLRRLDRDPETPASGLLPTTSTRRAAGTWTLRLAVALSALGAGVYGGLEYTRRSAGEKLRLEAEASRLMADRAAATKKAEEQAERSRREEEQRSKAAERARLEAEEKRFREGAERAFEAMRKAELEVRREREGRSNPAAIAPPVHRVLTVDEERRLRGGDEFQECRDCPRMVVVPAGEFSMGLDDSPWDEKPARKVTIDRSFGLGKFEVTLAEWDACIADGGCKHRSDDRGWGRDRRPVNDVSWEIVTKEYLPWLERRTGRAYRLPSEAEWEYAARAGSRTKYAWGDEIGRALANCDGCGSAWDGKSTAPGGSFSANPFGLHDMYGNVWEWVEDCYRNSYDEAPRNGTAVSGPANCPRVLRGGAWNSNAPNLRSVARLPLRQDDRSSKNYLGFRVARTLASLATAPQSGDGKSIAPNPSREGEAPPAASQAPSTAEFPDIKSSAANSVPTCVTPERLTAYVRSRNPDLDPRFESVAAEYKRIGEELGVRWDYAFYQMILETGALTYRRGNRSGDVKPAQNNFAGLGATGGSQPGESFKDIPTGVRAHLQHLLLYAGATIDRPTAERTQKLQEWQVLKSWHASFKRPITFADLARKWAPGSNTYARMLQAIAERFKPFCTPP